MRRAGAMIFVASVGALASIVPASAQTAAAPPAPPSIVELAENSPQVVLPNVGKRGEQSYTVGQIVSTVPIRWQSGGVLQGTAKIQIGDDATLLTSGTALRGVTLRDSRSKRAIPAFCEGEPHADAFLGSDTALGSLVRAVGVSQSSRGPDNRFCLIDLDGDGMAERSLYLDRFSNANLVYPMRPVRIAPTPNAPLAIDRYRFTWTLSDIAADGSSIAVTVDVMEKGNWRKFDQIGATPHVTRVLLHDQKLPLRTSIFGAEIEVVAVDAAARTVTLRWPDDADAAKVLPLGTEIEQRVSF